MVKIKIKTFRGKIAIVAPQGRLILGEICALRDTVHGLIGSDYRRIVIDLSQVDKIDCAGLGELVSYYTEAREAGIFLALQNPTRRIRDLLVITRLVTVFPIINPEVWRTAA